MTSETAKKFKLTPLLVGAAVTLTAATVNALMQKHSGSQNVFALEMSVLRSTALGALVGSSVGILSGTARTITQYRPLTEACDDGVVAALYVAEAFQRNLVQFVRAAGLSGALMGATVFATNTASDAMTTHKPVVPASAAPAQPSSPRAAPKLSVIGAP